MLRPPSLDFLILRMFHWPSLLLPRIADFCGVRCARLLIFRASGCHVAWSGQGYFAGAGGRDLSWACSASAFRASSFPFPDPRSSLLNMHHWPSLLLPRIPDLCGVCCGRLLIFGASGCHVAFSGRGYFAGAGGRDLSWACSASAFLAGPCHPIPCVALP